jgi:hypothetical protein
MVGKNKIMFIYTGIYTRQEAKLVESWEDRIRLNSQNRFAALQNLNDSEDINRA